MIKYLNRYSDNEFPDNMGRWARLAIYKNIRIAWISRIETKDKVMFSVSCHFPTVQNDTANEHKAFDSLEDAKYFINERWNWFANKIKDA